MPSITFQDCTCPHCKAKLDDVPEKTRTCPACNQPLDRREVYATRNYGSIVLPPWIIAFTWPLLIMIIGVVLFFYFYSTGIPDLFIPGIVVAIGMVFFFFKLNSSGN